MLRIGALLLAAPFAVVLALSFGPDPVRIESARPLIHRQDDFAGSLECRACHADHWESWSRTFHSTMTQRVNATTVSGAFDGSQIAWAGKFARPFRRDGRFLIDVPARDGGRRTAEVALAVGSRRYQQYFEREVRGDGAAFVRLPILWHVESRRWLHLDAVFLEPDSDDFDLHRTTWNANCIFCHNTGPRPHAADASGGAAIDGGFDSTVADLGVACESCHGPGAEHAARMRGLRTRIAARLGASDDLAIVDPLQLDPERSASVCGQCHGQRLPNPIDRAATWITTGPTFRAGARLADHVSPIEIDTKVPSAAADADLFRARFWSDGTPRLTAYEYQGTVASSCAKRGPMTCTDCHSMHAPDGGDVRGQVKEGMRGNAMCTRCHAEIDRDLSAHTKHRADGPGSRCVECHMPRIVYGVLDVHRSHRIEIPNARRDAEAGRPNACTLCHLDRDVAWAARGLALWTESSPDFPRSRKDGAPIELPDSIASILAGDPVQRVVFAAALARGDAPIDARTDAVLRVMLAVTLGDAYPSIRWTARSSLIARERASPLCGVDAVTTIDPFGPRDRHSRVVSSLLDRVAVAARERFGPLSEQPGIRSDWTVDLSKIASLTDLQGDHPIAIGE